jgi:GT2 family glycosyltransferase
MGAWRRDVFDRIGLFDEELVRDQDDEFNYRLRAHGGKILLSPKIKSTYTVRGTPGKLWKQYYQYGFWKVRVLQKHPRQMRPRQFVPPLFVLSLLVSLVLAALSFARRTPHIAPFNLILGTWYLIPGFYLLANLAASISTALRRKHGWRTLPLLPLVYAILHLSYGSGFLVGLIRFAHRWGDKQGQVPSFDLSTSPSE